MTIFGHNKTLTELIACAGREAGLRKNVYPRWVEQGRMKKEAADHEIECMECIVTILKTCQLLEDVSAEMRQKSEVNQKKLDL